MGAAVFVFLRLRLRLWSLGFHFSFGDWVGNNDFLKKGDRIGYLKVHWDSEGLLYLLSKYKNITSAICYFYFSFLFFFTFLFYLFERNFVRFFSFAKYIYCVWLFSTFLSKIIKKKKMIVTYAERRGPLANWSQRRRATLGSQRVWLLIIAWFKHGVRKFIFILL